MHKQYEKAKVAVLLSVAALNLVAGSAQEAVAQEFTRISTGPEVSDAADSWGVSAVDYNADGWPDIFVANLGNIGAEADNMLFRNNGDGTFTQVENVPPVRDGGLSRCGMWADADNDGYPELFVANRDYIDNFLYFNNGDGTFRKVNSGPVVNNTIRHSALSGHSYDADWADYDNDGFVDLFVANRDNEENFLFRNIGNGEFETVTGQPIATDDGESYGGSFVDINADAYPDLMIWNDRETAFFYENDREGTLVRSNFPGNVQPNGRVRGAGFADYDNDGYLDVFLVFQNELSRLGRNNGAGRLNTVEAGALGNDGGASISCVWGDFDNDADVDLFVTNQEQNNFYYRNDGGGVFSKREDLPITNDGGASTGVCAADFNGDGFLDLYVANSGGENNAHYRNNGNTNNWIKISLQGRFSNRQGIGARVRVKARVQGRDVWQLRTIRVQSGPISQSETRAHFGLGDAEEVDSVVVEWPSGARNVLVAQAARQTLTIIENDPPTALEGGENGAGGHIVHLYPHPVRETVAIRWEQKNGGISGLEIRDLHGRVLRHFTPEYRAGGEYTLLWDARDDRGNTVTAGAYIYRLFLDAAIHEGLLIVKP